VFLATVEDPSVWETSEQTMVLFLEEGAVPPARLVDPNVIGLRSAEGIWLLLLWDARSRRAFYSELRAGWLPELEAARYLDDGLDPER
jgi:hypothetical protein